MSIFLARGDNSTAANSEINSVPTSQIPVTTLEFIPRPTTEDPDGDLHLEPNNGDVDPDTQVKIDGQTYDFTVLFAGYLPMTKKFTDLGFGGKEVVVISAGGQRYYFITDGSGTLEVMSALPNGSVPITDVQTRTVLCFAGGTQLATPTGERSVEDLKVGDPVSNGRRRGQTDPLDWPARDLGGGPDFQKGTSPDLHFRRKLWPRPAAQ